MVFVTRTSDHANPMLPKPFQGTGQGTEVAAVKLLRLWSLVNLSPFSLRPSRVMQSFGRPWL